MTPDLTAPWDACPIVVIDVESTGVDPAVDRVVEIAAVRFQRGEVVSKWSSLIDPGVPIPEQATGVHGITDAMVMGAPALIDVADKLFEVCEGAVPCAYNAVFDRALLHAVITGTDCAAFDPAFPGWIDPLVVIREVDRYVPGSGRHKLDATCRRWGVPFEGGHRAINDATATGRLLYRLLEKGAVKSSTLRSMLATIERKRCEQEVQYQQYLTAQSKKADAK